MSNKEHSIQRASNDVDLGLFDSIRKAADYYDVPKSTVAYRRAGRPSIAETERISQRLSKQEEKVLIQYFQDLQRQHLCPNYAQIRRMVTKLLQNKGDKNRLGKHYVERLIARHPELKTRRNRQMDIKRLIALDSGIIERFFAEFEHLCSMYGVKSQDIYNINETGFQIGQTASKYVVFNPAMGRPVALISDNTQWVSIIECINTEKAIKPYLIFVGKSPKHYMFPQHKELPDVIWAFFSKGWTDKELTVDWLH